MKSTRFYTRKACLALGVLLPLAALSTTAQASCPHSAVDRLNGLFFGPAAGNRHVTVLAHRGLWGKYHPDKVNVPENSSQAIIDAANHCVDGVEIDVKMTGDGVPIVMHDFNLGRTTNIWTRVFNGSKYSPETNIGSNYKVDQIGSAVVGDLRLLTPDRTQVTGWHVPTVEQAIRSAHFGGEEVVPVVFDVKTVAAARAVSRVAGQVQQNPTLTMAMKVNASLYQSRAAFAADVPNMRGIPVFVTNNVAQINVNQVRDAWAGNSNTVAIEANVKSVNGWLQSNLLNWAKERRSPVGTFNAIPDYPGGGGRFYDNDGHCCYTLASKFVVIDGIAERSDLRGDWNYLNNQGFTFVTSDNALGLMTFFRGKNKQ